MKSKDLLAQEMHDHLTMMQEIRSHHLGWIEQVGHLVCDRLQAGHRILVAGNGGSAADSQHFAAELMGRFTLERRAFPAIALTTDTSALTAIANDYRFESVFSRQVEGLGAQDDLFIAISTSGNSANLVKALNTARERAMTSIALLGKSGGTMRELADHALVVPSSITQRIQEAHEWILHSWCAMVDGSMEQNT